MAPAVSMNDAVLGISLLYLSVDMQYQWAEFADCHWPVHRWLLISYVFIMGFRAAHILGTTFAAADSGDFLLNLRHKETLPRVLLNLTWLLVLPLFAAWTAVGTYWLWDSKRLSGRCLPMGMPLMFIITWQTLSYAWIIIHTTLGGIAWILERRLRNTEANLRAVADTDTLSRWGQVSELSGYTALNNGSSESAGLSPDQIKAMPEARASDLLAEDEECECSICLGDIQGEDSVRKLSGCGHVFHRACIDLWLLRSEHCPLCKQNVLVETCKTCSAEVTESVESFEMEHWHV